MVGRVTAAFGARLDGEATPAPLRRGPVAGAGRAPVRRSLIRTGRPSRPTSCSAAPGWPGSTSAGSPLGVLNSALGGGMSSRLFQEIREKRGLAYSVYSFALPVRRRRPFGVVRGCRRRKVPEVLALVRERAGPRWPRDGITAEELARGKGQAQGRRWCSAWRTPAPG